MGVSTLRGAIYAGVFTPRGAIYASVSGPGGANTLAYIARGGGQIIGWGGGGELRWDTGHISHFHPKGPNNSLKQ